MAVELHTPMGPGFFIFFQNVLGGVPEGVPARDRPVYLDADECEIVGGEKPDWVEEELKAATEAPLAVKSDVFDIDQAIRDEYERITKIERKIKKRRCRKAIAMLLMSL